MAVGLYGKVPTRGDFVSSELSPEVIEMWDATMSALRGYCEEQLGAQWTDLWDRAPAWGFWIGANVPAGPAAGILRTSADRVGRRFPMLLLADGTSGLPAPPLLEDPESLEWYADAVAISERLMDRDSKVRPADIAAELRDPPVVIGPPDDALAAFFAQGSMGLSALCRDVRNHDHGLAAAGRSYWWVEASDGASVYMALEGLPDPAMGAALLQACTQPAQSAPSAADSAEDPPDVFEEEAPAPEPMPDVDDDALDLDQDAPDPEIDETLVLTPDHREDSPFSEAQSDESPFGDAPKPKPRPGLAARLRGRH